MAKNDDKQLLLFEREKSLAEKEWLEMPEFHQDDLMPYRTIKVHFRSEEDAQKFAQFIGQRITKKTKFLWYPKAEIANYADKRWVDENGK